MNEGLLLRWKDPVYRVLFMFGIIAALIPVNKTLIPGFLGLLFIACFFLKKFTPARNFVPLYILAGIFILHLTGLGFSEHISEAKSELEYKMSYIVFPILSFLVPPFKKEWTDRLLDLFTVGCISFALGSSLWGLNYYFHTGDTAQLTYGELSKPFHPTYMATYHALAIAWVLFRLNSSSGKAVRWIGFVFLTISSAYIIMLASKAGILSMGIAISFGAIFFLRSRNISQLWIPLALCCIASLIAFKVIPTSSQRIDAAISTVTEGTSEADREVAHSSVKLRQVVWKASMELIHEHPWGVGTGDTTPELVKKYQAIGETYAAEKQLNCHNQFFQVTCEHGWIALLLFITGLAMMVIRSLRKKQWIFTTFLALCIFNFLFESFLEVQAGVVFFFFFSLIFLNTEEGQAS